MKTPSLRLWCDTCNGKAGTVARSDDGTVAVESTWRVNPALDLSRHIVGIDPDDTKWSSRPERRPLAEVEVVTCARGHRLIVDRDATARAVRVGDRGMVLKRLPMRDTPER